MNEVTSKIPLTPLETFSEDQLNSESSVKLDGRVSQHFSVFTRVRQSCKTEVSDSRRDYYKITLISKGSGIFIYDSQRYEITEPTLAFINPTSMLSWETTSPIHKGFYCMFRESFFGNHQKLLHELKDYPLFRIGNNPLLILSDEQIESVEHIYQKMMAEYTSSKSMKARMLMLHLQQLLLEGRRIHQEKAPEDKDKGLDAAHRHAQQFLELLEDQFPIASIQQQVALNSPAQFAEELSIHSNHLNTQVKQVTGESVRAHIQQRLLLEARLLLTHTEWPVADIAFCLGFNEPASFSHFIKRHIDQTPSSLRS